MTRQRPLEVAADGRVADRLLAHVARLQEQAARAVGPAPHPLGADSRLHVLARGPVDRLARLQHGGDGGQLAIEGLVDVARHERRADLGGGPLGGEAGLGGGEAGRHEEGAQGLGRAAVAIGLREVGVAAVEVAPGDDEAEQAVAAPRKRHADGLEGTRLLEVVADAERQRVEDVLAERGAPRARLVRGRGRKKLLCGREGVGEALAARGRLGDRHVPHPGREGRGASDGVAVHAERRVLAPHPPRAVRDRR